MISAERKVTWSKCAIATLLIALLATKLIMPKLNLVKEEDKVMVVVVKAEVEDITLRSSDAASVAVRIC